MFFLVFQYMVVLNRVYLYVPASVDCYSIAKGVSERDASFCQNGYKVTDNKIAFATLLTFITAKLNNSGYRRDKMFYCSLL